MSEIRVLPLSETTLLGLINGWGTIPRRADPAVTGELPDATRLLEVANGNERETVAKMVSNHSPDDLATIADRLFVTFGASSRDQIQALNGILADTRPTPAFDESGSVHWIVRSAHHMLLASAGITISEHVRAFGNVSRLGVCGAHGCADAFIDRSQAGNKRHCVPNCTNRSSVASHRARSRTTRPRRFPYER